MCKTPISAHFLSHARYHPSVSALISVHNNTDVWCAPRTRCCAFAFHTSTRQYICLIHIGWTLFINYFSMDCRPKNKNKCTKFTGLENVTRKETIKCRSLKSYSKHASFLARKNLAFLFDSVHFLFLVIF